jgi:hypothetical protein
VLGGIAPTPAIDVIPGVERLALLYGTYSGLPQTGRTESYILSIEDDVEFRNLGRMHNPRREHGV